MILYLDTSALVPLLINEPSTTVCARLWDGADTVSTARIAYVEVSAALGMAHRMGRINDAVLSGASRGLDELWTGIEVVELGRRIVSSAAELAISQGLRGYDAVHCASAAELSGDSDLVAAAGDSKLVAAWTTLGLATANTAIPSHPSS